MSEERTFGVPSVVRTQGGDGRDVPLPRHIHLFRAGEGDETADRRAGPRRAGEHRGTQQHSQREQDRSEVRSVELERLLAEGMTLIERRDAIELMRDQAGEHYMALLGHAWQPCAGSRVNRKALTAAMIDSRDYIAARKRAETEVMLPAGPKVAFTGGLDFSDHRAIWDALDRVLAKPTGMVLLHGGSPRGAERTAAAGPMLAM